MKTEIYALGNEVFNTAKDRLLWELTKHPQATKVATIVGLPIAYSILNADPAAATTTDLSTIDLGDSSLGGGPMETSSASDPYILDRGQGNDGHPYIAADLSRGIPEQISLVSETGDSYKVLALEADIQNGEPVFTPVFCEVNEGFLRAYGLNPNELALSAYNSVLGGNSEGAICFAPEEVLEKIAPKLHEISTNGFLEGADACRLDGGDYVCLYSNTGEPQMRGINCNIPTLLKTNTGPLQRALGL